MSEFLDYKTTFIPSNEPFEGYKICSGWSGNLRAYGQNGELRTQYFEWYDEIHGYTGFKKEVNYYYDHYEKWEKGKDAFDFIHPTPVSKTVKYFFNQTPCK